MIRRAAIARSLRLLDANRVEGCIVPSRSQYPHQWFWDSCFHAIVLAGRRPAAAVRELESLYAGQWKNGMFPHMRFLSRGAKARYRPNAGDWKTGRPTSGITQPPIIATAARIVYAAARDRRFLRRAYARIRAYHLWLQKSRDPEGSGLVAVLHPWESGMDNSPVYGAAKDRYLRDNPSPNVPPRVDTRKVRAKERPTDDYYRFYWGLIAGFQEDDWDARGMYRRGPVRIADALFNGIWTKANEDLAALAGELGKSKDAALFARWAERSRRAMCKFLWCPRRRFFYSYDLRRGRRILVKTVGGFMPLLAGGVEAKIAAALAECLADRREFFSKFGVPSTSRGEAAFDPVCYWRGPVWISTHWLLVQGLLRCGRRDEALRISEISRGLVERSGYREYYHPFKGEGLGAHGFSWSALAHRMIVPREANNL